MRPSPVPFALRQLAKRCGSCAKAGRVPRRIATLKDLAVQRGAATMKGLRSLLYLLARLLGDISAASKGRIGRRIGRRATGRAAGRLLRKLWR